MAGLLSLTNTQHFDLLEVSLTRGLRHRSHTHRAREIWAVHPCHCRPPATARGTDSRWQQGFCRFDKLKFVGQWFAIGLLLQAAFLLGACTGKKLQTAKIPTDSRTLTDEAGKTITVPARIERFISLAPNLTEIVYAIGAGDRLVGNTTFCDFPPEAKTVQKVGDTLQPSIERILGLRPQLVLVSTASQLEAFTKQLDEQKIAVYVTNPRSLEEVFSSITTLGDLLGARDRASSLVADVRRRTAAVEEAIRHVKPLKVFYQVSGEPLYTIGRDAYLTDLVRRAGGISVTADVLGAFPRLSNETALAARPEAIILPTGGSMGAANSTVAAALKHSPAVLSNRVYKLNDDHLSRPGPRLIDGLEEMARALHPEAFK
ncbi:MAG: ABC transporter substrate-binding protein [Pyrinomonadaceae bacterium]